MKARSLAVSILLAAWSLGSAATVGAQDEAGVLGRSIAEKADSADRGFGDASAQLAILLVDERGGERRWHLGFQVLEGADEGERTKLVFSKPMDLRGTAVLTHSHAIRDDEQWVYLPALGRVRRITGASRGSSFMGSDFAYEDIGTRELDEYRYRFLRDELVDGQTLAVVESRSLESRSLYGREEVWFTRDSFRVTRIDYFDTEDQLLKTLWVRGYRRVGADFWRPSEMEMVNHLAGSRTILSWTDWELGTGLTTQEFEPSDLGRR